MNLESTAHRHECPIFSTLGRGSRHGVDPEVRDWSRKTALRCPRSSAATSHKRCENFRKFPSCRMARRCQVEVFDGSLERARRALSGSVFGLNRQRRLDFLQNRPILTKRVPSEVNPVLKKKGKFTPVVVRSTVANTVSPPGGLSTVS